MGQASRLPRPPLPSVELAPETIPGGLTTDRERRFYYSADWQLLEERIDDNSGAFNVDRIGQQVWGLRYIDDAVLRRVFDGTVSDYASGSREFDRTHHYLTDAQFNVVALLGPDATSSAPNNLAERIRYTPYGEARHSWPRDLNGNGNVNNGDRTAFDLAWDHDPPGAPTTPISNSAYDPDADFDRDGDVDGDDWAIIATETISGLASGRLSDAGGTDNAIGFAGAVYNWETGLYTIRHRTYIPAMGRWAQRDPAGYVDGQSLYEYAMSSPIGRLDPLGLDDGYFLGQYWHQKKLGNDLMAAKIYAENLGRGPQSLIDAQHERTASSYLARAHTFDCLAAGASGVRDVSFATAGGIGVVLGASVVLPAQVIAGVAAPFVAAGAYDLGNRTFEYADELVSDVKSGQPIVTPERVYDSARLAGEYTLFGWFIKSAKNTRASREQSKSARDQSNSREYSDPVKLHKRLASERQLGEHGTAMSGGETGTKFRDVDFVVRQYGGRPQDWVKMTSTRHRAPDGTAFETHWVENLQTGQKIEFKTKFLD